MKKQRNQYKLIVSDLDGTIFDQTYTLTEELGEAVRRAREKGCEFTFATGRLYPSAVQFAAELGLTVPLITYNGALIRNPITNETVMEMSVPVDKAREIIRMTDSSSVMRFVFKEDVVYTDIDFESTKHYAEALKVSFVHTNHLVDVLDKAPIMLTLRDDPPEIKKWTNLLRRHFGQHLYLANSRPFFLDIANSRVSKGHALNFLSEAMGLKPSEVIAIGDEGNDLEMMKAAGLGAAVANASEIVKESADYVTEAEYWRGVIEVIERFVL